MGNMAFPMIGLILRSIAGMRAGSLLATSLELVGVA